MVLFSIVAVLLFATTINASIGQRFILSLPENATHQQLSAWLKQTRPAGVILLASHVKQRSQAKKLIAFLQAEIKKLGLPPLIISIDWEGGIVSRPTEAGGFSSSPSPWLLAQAGRSACFNAGMLIGSQLNSIGVTMDFAPSLDLFDQHNQILATRCFSDNPSTTPECGVAFAHGLQVFNVIPVIKHFPGIGLGSGDTHNEVVHIEAHQKILQKHMYPFVAALEQDIPCIMNTHATFKKFGEKPITLSEKAIRFLESKNKNALLITDDFSMKASHHHKELAQNMLDALQAGYHLIIFSGSAEHQVNTLNNLEKMYAALSIAEKKRISQKTHAVVAFKKAHGEKSHVPKLTIHEPRMAQWLARRCIKPLSNKQLDVSKKIVLISVDLAKIRQPETWFIKNDTSYFGSLLSTRGMHVDEFVLDPRSSESINQIDDILVLYANDQDVQFMIQTFFYADNVWNRVQFAWLKKFIDLQNRIIVLSLGHPHEQAALPDTTIINLGSFHIPLLQRAAQLLCNPITQTGADILLQNPAQYLNGKRFGLLCHKASIAHRQFLPDALYAWTKEHSHDGTKLAALFSPEHGLNGDKEAYACITSQENSHWDCPIYSLHGKEKKPAPHMLKNLDLLIVDLQDVGARCFTYVSTLQYVLEAAAENNVPVLVLDRPNPLQLWGKQGPMLEEGFESLVGLVKTPFLYGSSIGALAKEINKNIHANLTVIDHIKQDECIFFATPFTPPSPNLISIDHIYAYPITVFLEGTNYSEGRGTQYPFLQFGAPWIDAEKLAYNLNLQNIPGIYFEPIHFTPVTIKGVAEKPKYHNTQCHGVFMHVYDHASVKAIDAAQTILKILFSLYPEQSQWITWGKRYGIDLLVGSKAWRITQKVV